MITVLTKWTELKGGPKALQRLGRALRRRANRLLDLIDGGARQKRQWIHKTQQRKMWARSARAQSETNAQALQSNLQVISRLEDMIAARIARPVRHVRSEFVLKFGDKGARTHIHRRAYTKHWFEVSGVVDAKLRPLLDTEGQLVVFLKSALKLGVCAPLEYILSEQGGNGFRAPYFFGSCTASGLKIGAWEAVETDVVPFKKHSLETQTRIVEAIAAVNTVGADRTVPVHIKWVNIKPRWFEEQFRCLDGPDRVEWKELHGRTMDVMRCQDALVRRLRRADGIFLTHNDVSPPNLSVPPAGDVLLLDWEIATLSVPGADLGFLAYVDSSDHLLSCYVSKMAQHGFELDIDAVRYTIDFVQGFRSLHRGWRKQRTGEAELGLALLSRHLD